MTNLKKELALMIPSVIFFTVNILSVVFVSAFLTEVFTPAAQATVYAPQFLWDKKQLVICTVKNRRSTKRRFEITHPSGRVNELSETEIRRVKSIVNQEFTPQKTGIHFIGWNACQDTENPDVIFAKLKNPPSFFSKGLKSSGTSSIARSDIVFEKSTASVISLASFEKSVILHEFSHMAGLVHEENHEAFLENDVFSDPNCLRFFNRLFPENVDIDVRSPQFKKRVLGRLPEAKILGREFQQRSMGGYDSLSIANRCNLLGRDPLDANLSLSPGDRRALKRLYP